MRKKEPEERDGFEEAITRGINEIKKHPKAIQVASTAIATFPKESSAMIGLAIGNPIITLPSIFVTACVVKFVKEKIEQNKN